MKLWSRKLFREVMHIGWPLGVNMSSWVFSQLVIYMFIAMLGTNELAARTYMHTLESFCFLLGYSLALAGQIKDRLFIRRRQNAGSEEDGFFHDGNRTDCCHC